MEQGWEATIAHLAHLQRANGSFGLRAKGSAAVPIVSEIHAHAQLLDLLQELSIQQLQPITRKLAVCLATTLERWRTETQWTEVDSRVLFGALAAVYTYDATLISQAMLATAVHHLVSQEVEPGGPYHNAAHPDALPDHATNTAVARFVAKAASPLPKLNAFLAQQPSKQQPKDLLNGYVFEALDLAKTLRGVKPRNVIRHNKPLTREYATQCALVRKNALASVRHLDPLVRHRLEQSIEEVLRVDRRHEIAPLAFRFSATIARRSTTARSEAMLTNLGIGNVFAWLAYTIYDDFLDGEGQPALLPVANIALRRSVAAFRQALPMHLPFQQLVAGVFDAIDNANAWEVAHCRFPVQNGNITLLAFPDYADLHNLHDRSLAHALPVMGSLAGAGISVRGKAAGTLFDAFKEYLVVRQLSDDLHDWKDDLTTGQISYVVSELLSHSSIPRGAQSLAHLLPQLEQQFWRQTLPELCEMIRRRCAHAKKLIHKSGLVTSDNVLHKLLQSIDNSTTRTLTEYKHANQFIAAYRG